MRLFGEQGYDSTTIEQIAEAAEVSPSTFFRYFPTKEDVVIQDDYDPMLAAAFLAQPASLHPLTAMRGALKEVFELAFEQDRATIVQRIRLIWSIPSLRSRQMEGQVATVTMLTAAIAERTGRSVDDFEVRVFAGAVTGAWISAIQRWIESDCQESLLDLLDEVMDFLQKGMPI